MDARRYNTVAVALHWAIALLIVGQIVGGIYMHNLPNSAPAKFDIFQLHKSFGLTILALTFVRLGWRLFHEAPALPEAMPGWQKLAARATHWLFYFLMLAVPVLGLAAVSVSPKDIPTEWFGLFVVPHLGFLDPGADPAATEGLFMELHKALSIAIVGLLALHVAAALKHGLVNRDGVLRSMAPGAGAVIGVVIVFAAFGVGAAAYFATKPGPVDITAAPQISAPEASAPVDPPASGEALATSTPPATNSVCGAETALAVNWRVDEATSRLRFIGAQNGRPFEGVFGAFAAEIAFDDNDLDQSWLRVTVQTASAATGDQLIDSTIPGGDWFAVKDFPTATFTACDIRQVADGEYEAAGTLTVKDVSHDITLPFSLSIDGDVATASGGVDLIRTDFGLGEASSWLDDEGVALEARAEFSVSAARID